MVLAELMYRSALPFQLLHVNYGLRQEADTDEAFVRHWAEKRSIPYRIRKVEENEWKAFERKGIQHAARTIRYVFFDELKQAGEFDFILTAHHAQDLLERMLMAITRGEQWTALTGLQAKRDHFLRPLLQADRESIEEFARTEKIEWREDASNSGSAYLRNRVRHELIPFFKKENPSWSEAVLRMHDELLAVKNLSSAAYSEWTRK